MSSDMSSDISQPAPGSDTAIFNHATFSALVQLISGGGMHPHLHMLRSLMESAVALETTPDEARGFAHKLVSQAGNLGFEQICSCSRDVENAPGRGGVARQVDALHQAMRAANPTLDRLLAQAA